MPKAPKKVAEEAKGEKPTKKHDKKTVCPITRKQFKELAKNLPLTIAGIPHIAEVKEFGTGSFGWYMNDKVFIPIGDKEVKVQIGMNLTVVGSKDLPKD